MARRQKKRAETPSIAREEWDFSQIRVPSGRHLRWCWHFEFTREYIKGGRPIPSKAFVFLPKLLREKAENSAWLVKTPFQVALRQLPNNILESGVSEAMEDWLKINSPPVRLAVDGHEEGELTYIVGPALKDGIPEIVGGDPEEFVTRIVIDWDYMDGPLCDGFMNLIQGLRPRKPIEARGNHPMRRMRKELKALGAHRVLEADFTQYEAIAHTGDTSGNSLYKYPADWSKAKDAVFAVLNKWPPSLRLDEWPNDLD